MDDLFLDLVDDRVTTEFLEKEYGQDARDKIDLGTMSKAEYEYLVDAVITAFNESMSDGQIDHAAVHYRNLQGLLELDDETRQMYEEMQNQNPLEKMFGGGSPV